MRILTACALLATGLAGQDLLRDINTSVSTTASTAFGSSITLGSKVLFSADDFSRGSELHILDANGARRVLDLYPGPTGSNPSFHAVFAGDAIFSARNEQGGGIWRSDGTASGTKLIAPFSPEERVVTWNGALWFWRYVPPGSLELWKLDGSTYNGQIVASLPFVARPATQLYALPSGLVTMVGSTAIFSDGTSAGTKIAGRLWDFQPGIPGVVVGNLLYFSAGSTTTGVELWKSDGTEVGTVEVRDIEPGLNSSLPQSLTALGTRVVFSAADINSRKLWISDGTSSGTMLLGAAEVGTEIVSDGTRVYFSAFRGGTGFELWTSDGTPAGTREVANLNPSGDSKPTRLFVAGGRVHFAANDGVHGREPWSSDGTAAGTAIVADVSPGAASSMPDALPSSSRAFMASLGGRAHFGADDGVHGYEIWGADVNATSAALVADLNPRLTSDAGIQQIVVRDRDAFFVARDATGLAIWRTDGTSAGTQVAIRNVPNAMVQIEGLQVLGERLIFRAMEVAAGSPITLFASDGTEAGTVRLTQPYTYSPYEFTSVVYQGKLWFPWRDIAHGSELWTTDGTVAGTALALDVTAGPTDSNPRDLAVAGDKLYFTSSLTPLESKVWSSNGSSSGTTELASGGIRVLVGAKVLGNVLLFFGGSTGLTRSDGTAAGTFSIDMEAGLQGAVFAGRYWYAKLTQGGIQAELWSTDATVAGTRREVAFPPVNNISSSIGSIAAGTDRLFFSLYTGTTGQELWSTDGTPGNAGLVREIAPGTQNGTSGPFVNLTANQRLLFPAFDPLLGTELFVSDGTGSGTRQVADVNPGPGYSSPKLFTRLGRHLLFVADDGVHGAELFAMDLAKIGGAVAAPFGTPCGATAPRIGALGAPTLGSFGFWLSLTNAPQNAPLVWVLGGSRQDVPLYGCTFHVGGPWLALGGATSAAGEAVLAIPVPADPRLLGSDLYAQTVVADASWFTFSGGMQVLVGGR